MADFDPKAKERSAELREKMKRAPQKIARDRRACVRPSAKASRPGSGTSSARRSRNAGARRAERSKRAMVGAVKLGRMPRQPEQESEEQCGFPIPMSLLHATSHQ
jgi:hypothetical protein